MGAQDILAGAVRTPVDAAAVRRRMSDRMVQRVPAVATRLARRVLADEPGGRLRTQVLVRSLTAAWAAWDRDDWDYLARLNEPDIVMTVGEGIWPDYPPRVDGWDALRQLMEQSQEGFRLNEAWPIEIIDVGGPHVIATVRSRIEGEYSGLELTRDISIGYEISPRGRVARQCVAEDLADVTAWIAARQ
jgi:hypothetical protein